MMVVKQLFTDNIDRGLHFNLTSGKALLPDMSFTNEHNILPSLLHVMLASFLARLSYQDVLNELTA